MAHFVGACKVDLNIEFVSENRRCGVANRRSILPRSVDVTAPLVVPIGLRPLLNWEKLLDSLNSRAGRSLYARPISLDMRLFRYAHEHLASTTLASNSPGQSSVDRAFCLVEPSQIVGQIEQLLSAE